MKLPAIAFLSAALAFAASNPLPPRTIRVVVRPVTPPEHILKPSEFTVRLNGRAAHVSSEKTPRDEQMILVVLDLAGNIADAQTAKDALVAELDKLPPTTFVALIRAQDGPAVVLDPTADRTKLALEIQASPVAGKAGLLDSLVTVQSLADSIARYSNIRVATLYVTDSSVTNYREDFSNPVINSSDSHDLSRRFPGALIEEKIEKLESEIAGSETPLYIAHLHYGSSTLTTAYQSGLKRLAEASGGASAFCASPAEIPDAISRSLTDISSGYTLTIALAAKPSSFVHIHVDTPDNELIYRPRLLLGAAADKRP